MQLGLLLYIYTLNALIVFLILLWAFLSDRSTPNSHRLSWIILCLASTLWFVAVPLSMVEILRKVLQQRRTLPNRSNPPKYLG